MLTRKHHFSSGFGVTHRNPPQKNNKCTIHTCVLFGGFVCFRPRTLFIDSSGSCLVVFWFFFSYFQFVCYFSSICFHQLFFFLILPCFSFFLSSFFLFHLIFFIFSLSLVSFFFPLVLLRVIFFIIYFLLSFFFFFFFFIFSLFVLFLVFHFPSFFS